jgi:hypothetical protein
MPVVMLEGRFFKIKVEVYIHYIQLRIYIMLFPPINTLFHGGNDDRGNGTQLSIDAHSYTIMLHDR